MEARVKAVRLPATALPPTLPIRSRIGEPSELQIREMRAEAARLRRENEEERKGAQKKKKEKKIKPPVAILLPEKQQEAAIREYLEGEPSRALMHKYRAGKDEMDQLLLPYKAQHERVIRQAINERRKERRHGSIHTR